MKLALVWSGNTSQCKCSSAMTFLMIIATSCQMSNNFFDITCIGTDGICHDKSIFVRLHKIEEKIEEKKTCHQIGMKSEDWPLIFRRFNCLLHCKGKEFDETREAKEKLTKDIQLPFSRQAFRAKLC